METSIGETLREARNRRKLELSEVESAIKIRARYLRAIENEEWGVLPGGAYTRSFIRTYATHLGLDGERLAEEFRRADGAPSAEGARLEPVERRARRRSGVPGWVWVAAVSALLVGIMIGIGVAMNGDDGSPGGRESAVSRGAEEARQGEGPRAAPAPAVELELEATGEVWVCLLDAREEELIDGQILAAGAVEGPFRSRRFTAAFGNGNVSLSIDGREAETPPSSSPIGFEIDGRGELRELEEGSRPDCE